MRHSFVGACHPTPRPPCPPSPPPPSPHPLASGNCWQPPDWRNCWLSPRSINHLCDHFEIARLPHISRDCETEGTALIFPINRFCQWLIIGGPTIFSRCFQKRPGKCVCLYSANVYCSDRSCPTYFPEHLPTESLLPPLACLGSLRELHCNGYSWCRCVPLR